MKEGRENQQVFIFERTCTTYEADGIPKKWRIKEWERGSDDNSNYRHNNKIQQKKNETR